MISCFRLTFEEYDGIVSPLRKQKGDMKMLKVYYWNLCPHCHKAMEYLKSHGIPFEALDIEAQPEDVVRKIVEVNGGDDWVVPTMEYNGQWRPGQVFNAAELGRDLKAWGLME